jgi:hypothetical protein
MKLLTIPLLNFSKHYKGGVIEPSIQLAFGHNAEITLKKNFGHYR